MKFENTEAAIREAFDLLDQVEVLYSFDDPKYDFSILCR
jgi:hypothetical protein